MKLLEEHPRPHKVRRHSEVDVTVKISVAVHRAAKLLAIELGIPLFTLVEEALREKLEREK